MSIEGLKTRLGAILVLALVALGTLGIATAAFVVGSRIGARQDPTGIPSATLPFPAVSTSTVTPRPTKTGTPPPTNTPTVTPTATHTPTPTATPTPTPRVIITEVRSLGRLETAKYMLQTVIDLEREPSNVWEQMFGTDKLLLVASGEVVAGFDLALVESTDVTVLRDSVRIVLPPAEVLYSKVDNDRTYVYERATGLFRTPDPRIETEARQLAEQAMRARALEGEILQQAEALGRLQMEAFLRSLGFTAVEIIVRGE